MTPQPNTPPRSEATQLVAQLSQAVGSINNQLRDSAGVDGVQTSIQKLNANLGLVKAKFANPAINACGDFDSMCQSVINLQMAFGLLARAPVGVLKPFQLLHTAVKDLHISTLQTKIRSADTRLKKVRDEILTSLQTKTNAVGALLGRMTQLLPRWQQTLAIMGNVFGLIDLGVFVLFGKDSKDQLINDTLSSLKELASGINSDMQRLQAIFDLVAGFVKKEVADFMSEAAKAFAVDGLGSFASKIQGVMNNIGPIINAVNTAGGIVNGPVEALTSAIHSIPFIGGLVKSVDEKISEAVDKVLEMLHIKSLLEDAGREVGEALNITDFSQRVQNLISPLEKLAEPLGKMDTQLQAVELAIKQLEPKLADFEKQPVGNLFSILAQGLRLKHPELFQAGSNPTVSQGKKLARVAGVPTPSLLSEDMVSSVSSEEEAIDLVQHYLSNMDFLVTDVERVDGLDIVPDLPQPPPSNQSLALEASLPQEGLKAPENGESAALTDMPMAVSAVSAAPANPDLLGLPLPAPTLGYAFYEDESVSVLLRVTHQMVLDQQASARTQELAPLSSIPVVHRSHRVAAAATAGRSPKLGGYISKCADLSVAVNKAAASVAAIGAAATQADTDFASFAADAAQFGDHLSSMVQQIKPMLAASTTMLQLPIKYRTALTQAVAEAVRDAGASAAVQALIPALFATIDQTNTVINDVRKGLDAIESKTQSLSVDYQAFYNHASQITSPSRYSQTLGLAVTSLSSLVAALQGRLATTAVNLKALATAGETLFQQPDTLTDETAAKLDALYGRLEPLVDATLTQTQQLPSLIDALYTALAGVRGDLQTFFQATHRVSQLCSAAEKQVVSADTLRALCTRINDAVGPFEAILAQLHVQADTVSPASAPAGGSPAIAHRVAAIVATTPSPPPPSSKNAGGPADKSRAPASIAQPPAAVLKAANDALGGAPLQLLQRLLASALFAAIDKVVAELPGISDMEDELRNVAGMLEKKAELEQRLQSFESAVKQLIDIAVPKAAGVAAAAASGAVVTNPLLDDASSRAFVDVVGEIGDVVAAAAQAAKAAQATSTTPA
ncbi:hypothetical protein QBC47DRAFT_442017 [Echria macrotheca]|uniref:Uncharacterized protein n=1 Tax=Echria macrotheca TaxID=438768 RepID=A0AAJ0B0B1_9PEZI|nr:hypothetical protein QBC47DRAFT_442017 [Echria macrotheca]